MYKEETIKVLYNTSYGELRPSNKAIELYNLRMKEIDPNFILIDNIENAIYDILRHDPILIQIYYEIGKEFEQNAIVWCDKDAIPQLLLLK